MKRKYKTNCFDSVFAFCKILPQCYFTVFILLLLCVAFLIYFLTVCLTLCFFLAFIFGCFFVCLFLGFFLIPVEKFNISEHLYLSLSELHLYYISSVVSRSHTTRLSDSKSIRPYYTHILKTLSTTTPIDSPVLNLLYL